MSYAARMLTNTQTKTVNPIKEVVTSNAVLTKDISYIKDQTEILVKAGTDIIIDEAHGIALIGEDHVEMTSDEYTLNYLN